jgi:hypothetical protein
LEVEGGSKVSTLNPSTSAPATERSTIPTANAGVSDRTRRRVSLAVTALVLAWSTVELINLAVNHTSGPELYGVLVAAVTVGTGVISFVLLASSRRRVWASAGLLALWALVALGGVAGMVAHIVGPVAGHGPVDLRPRPIPAPLIFTALGVVGGAALFYGQRLRATLRREP